MNRSFVVKFVFCIGVAEMFFVGTCYSQTQNLTSYISSSSGQIPNFQSYPISTNQVVQVLGYIGPAGSIGSHPSVYGQIPGVPSPGFLLDTNSPPSSGFTNIVVTGNITYGAATLSISTPTTVTVISNYVPANAIVIPSDSQGPVQIILESSPDLINWTSTLPGTYGTSSTNRFFRVRAQVGN